MLAAAAKRTAGGIRLIDTWQVSIESDGSPIQAAQDLAKQLKAHQLSSFQLLIGLPRSQVDMLTLHLPPASTAELPEIVRNEVTRQLADLTEDSPIDFGLPKAPTENQPQTVEAAALRSETFELVNAVCEQLQQKPAQIVVRSLAIASLLVRQIRNLPPHSLLLNLLPSTADVSVLAGRHITFTRSVHLSIDPDGQPDIGHLADEIRRTLFVAPRQATSSASEAGEVEHVYMFADLDRNSTFVKQLADELQLTVSLLDPLADIEVPEGPRPEQTHRYAALIGMIRDYVDGTTTIDLAHPKQPPPPPRWGRKAAIYGLAGLVALSIVGAVLKREVNQAAEVAESLATDVDSNRELLKKLRGKTAVLDAVQRWQQSEINWLDELRRLSDRFPPADQAVVQRISMAPSAAARSIITMSVRVQDPSIIARLEQDLRNEAHQVSSQRISQSDPNQEFSTQFETSVIVTPPTLVPPAQSTPNSPSAPRR